MLFDVLHEDAASIQRERDLKTVKLMNLYFWYCTKQSLSQTVILPGSLAIQQENLWKKLDAYFLSFIFSRAADLNEDGAIDLEEFKLMLGMDWALQFIWSDPSIGQNFY